MTIADTCASCGHKGAEEHICSSCPQCGGPKSVSALRCYACAWPGRAPRSKHNNAGPDQVMPTARPVQMKFRVYCVSCGRATDVEVAARYAPRCQACGGTMLLEPIE
jgi:hypothetical protein